MDVTTSLEPCIQLSQIFGLVTFEVRHQNGVRVLYESEKRVAYTKMLFAQFCVLQGTILAKTALEPLEKGGLMAKCVRLIHMWCFSATLLFMYIVAAGKGGQISSTINLINRMSLLLPQKEECQRILSQNPKLMLCVLVYFLTSFLSSVTTIYSYRHNNWFRLFRSCYFAFNSWLENLFLSQFYTIANSLRAIFVGYNQNFTRAPPAYNTSHVIDHVHKMKSNDMHLKGAFHMFNSVYKYYFLFETAWLFMALVYFISKKELQINFIFWAVYTSFRMSVVLGICNDINKEVEKTAHHLHELFIEIDDPVLKEEIEIFSLQLMHRKAEFNACGFFKLDFSLLHSMIATVSTYIIILMQLQGDTKLQECIKVDHCTNCSHTPS